MPTNTTNQQITIPVGTDAAFVPQAFIDQTADLEGRLVQRYTSNADRTARNPAPATGELSWVNPNTWYDRYTGAKWIPVTKINAVKTVDQLVNNSVAFVDITDLVCPLPVANTLYSFESFIFYNSSTVADIKFTFTSPAGSDVRFGGCGGATTIAAVTGDGNYSGIVAPAALSFGGAGVGTALVAHVYGTVNVVATTGNLQMQFAQNTAEATNTTVTMRSWLSTTGIA